MRAGRRVTFIVLVVICIMGLNEIITGKTSIDLLSVAIEKSENPQILEHFFTILGVGAFAAICLDFAPPLVEKIKNSNVQSIVNMGLFIIMATVVVNVTPSKNPVEMRPWMTLGVVAVIIAIYVVDTIIEKKKGKKETPKDEIKREESE